MADRGEAEPRRVGSQPQRPTGSNEKNTRLMLAEKDEALKRVEALKAILDTPPTALTQEAHEDLAARYDIFRRYVKGFRAVGRALMLTRFVLANDKDSPSSPRRNPCSRTKWRRCWTLPASSTTSRSAPITTIRSTRC